MPRPGLLQAGAAEVVATLAKAWKESQPTVWRPWLPGTAAPTRGRGEAPATRKAGQPLAAPQFHHPYREHHARGPSQLYVTAGRRQMQEGGRIREIRTSDFDA